MFYLQQEYWIPTDVDVMYVTTRSCSHRTNQIRNVPSEEPPAHRVHGDRMRDARCRIQTPRRPSRLMSPSPCPPTAMGAYLDNRLHFMSAKGGWHVSFLEQDLKTSLPRRFVFQDEVKILNLARRGGASAEVNQPKVSALKEYKLEGFSVDRPD